MTHSVSKRENAGTFPKFSLGKRVGGKESAGVTYIGNDNSLDVFSKLGGGHLGCCEPKNKKDKTKIWLVS